jgi:hypothetical protein
MPAKLPKWIRLPSKWIESGGLKAFRWQGGKGADDCAALMVLMAMSHVTDKDTGALEVTYSQLEEVTGLSRAKVAAGIKILTDRQLILKDPDRRSGYKLANFGEIPWAMFPVRGHYQSGNRIEGLKTFTLRKRAELDALKLYFLIASRRDSKRNHALLSYDKISEYSGIQRNDISYAKTLLIGHRLIHVENVARGTDPGMMQAYRLSHLDSYVHAGTSGRRDPTEVVNL